MIQEEILAWHLENFECFPEAALRKAAVEIGELIQADFDLSSREAAGGSLMAVEVQQIRVAAELGDVLICLCAYAGRRGIDIEAALRRKWRAVSSRSPERIHRGGSTP